MFVFFASMTVCPFCGQVGCIGGAASAGVFGGVAAFLISLMRRTWTRTRRRPDTADAHKGGEVDPGTPGDC